MADDSNPANTLPPDRTTTPGQPKPADALIPKTTHEEDRVTAGQRRINIVWEATQALIALIVVVISTVSAAVLSLRSELDPTTRTVAISGFQFLTSIGFLVVGFYFGRTNHTRIGGVGGKDNPGTR